MVGRDVCLCPGFMCDNGQNIHVGDQRTSWNRQTDYDWKWCIQNLQEQPLISMNQKYSSYHNLIQCCSDFGFMPNIVLCTMENSLIYRFCQEKIGIGIDADVHPEKELLAGLRKIELYDAIPWKINLVCRKNTVNDNASPACGGTPYLNASKRVISRLQEICCNLD